MITRDKELSPWMVKTVPNNHGPFSSDFIGMNYDYPEASYEQLIENVVRAYLALEVTSVQFLSKDGLVQYLQFGHGEFLGQQIVADRRQAQRP